MERKLPASNLSVQEQATRVVNDKRLKDTWDASRHARDCGCMQCRGHWVSTLNFYAKLGTEKPEREVLPPRVIPIDRSATGWYDNPFGRTPRDPDECG